VLASLATFLSSGSAPAGDARDARNVGLNWNNGQWQIVRICDIPHESASGRYSSWQYGQNTLKSSDKTLLAQLLHTAPCFVQRSTIQVPAPEAENSVREETFLHVVGGMSTYALWQRASSIELATANAPAGCRGWRQIGWLRCTERHSVPEELTPDDLESRYEEYEPYQCYPNMVPEDKWWCEWQLSFGTQNAVKSCRGLNQSLEIISGAAGRSVVEAKTKGETTNGEKDDNATGEKAGG